ncbi:hypothetical protein [Ureibacillus sp. GCM10028918]
MKLMATLLIAFTVHLSGCESNRTTEGNSIKLMPDEMPIDFDFKLQ